MADLFRTISKSIFITIVILVICAVCVGCKKNRPVSGRQMQRNLDRAGREFDKELLEKIELTERGLASYNNRGLLEIDIQPADGTLLINDGEVGLSDDPLFLPVGTYTFEAVWPDGSRTSRKIFVKPCLGITSYDWDFSSESSGSSGNRKSNIKFNAPLHKTKVQLIKPAG